MNIIESVTIDLSKNVIEECLLLLAPTTLVTASMQDEDGWTLILEGPVDEVAQLLYAWNEVSV